MRNQKFVEAIGIFMLIAVLFLLIAGWALIIRWCLYSYGVVAAAFATILPIAALTVVIILYWTRRL